MVIYDFDPRNLPAEYLSAIGLMVAASAQTEGTVRDVVGALLGIDNADTPALTTHINAPTLDHIVRALVELHAPSADDVDALDDLMDEIAEAWKLRNIVVHNPLCVHPETKEVLSFRLKARGSLRLELVPVKAEDITAGALRVHDAGLRLMTYMMERGIGPRPREQPLRETLDRSKKARTARRAGNGDESTAK